MMSENKEQSQEEKTAEVLKDVFQRIADDHTDHNPLVSQEEASAELKGSDADVDRVTGNADQPTQEEADDQVKGSDADRDQ